MYKNIGRLGIQLNRLCVVMSNFRIKSKTLKYHLKET